MDDSFEPGRMLKGHYSLLKVLRYSMELIRGDVSSNLEDCVANPFLLDLQDMGFLNPSIPLNDIILDKCKIDRKKARVKVASYQKHVQDYDNLICIGVDCRVDKDTLIYNEIEENGVKRLKKRGTRAPLNIYKRDGHFK